MTKLVISPIFDNEDVVFTVGIAGKTDEAEAFLLQLESRHQARFRKYFVYLKEGKQIKSPVNMRHIKGVRDPTGGNAEVHELKVHDAGGLRLYVVKFQNRWYATHGRKKPKDKDVPKEAKKAFGIFFIDELERE